MYVVGGGTFNFGPLVLARVFLPAFFSTFCVLLRPLLSLSFPCFRRLSSLPGRPYIEKLTRFETGGVRFAEVH